MDDRYKKEFWAILNVTMELTNRPPLSKEAVITWWGYLNKYDIETVRGALDKWCDTEKKPPTPSEIKELCKPKSEYHKALPAPRNEEVSREGLAKINQVVADSVKPKKDMKAWAKRILATPKNYPDIAIRFAKEALEIKDIVIQTAKAMQ